MHVALNLIRRGAKTDAQQEEAYIFRKESEEFEKELTRLVKRRVKKVVKSDYMTKVK